MTTFIFDLPTGTYKSDELTAQLEARSRQPGPVLPQYGCVKFSGLERLADNQDVCRVLVYQRRFLRTLFPEAMPELRVGIAADFGRTLRIAWYSPECETILGEGYSVPDIDPEVVL